MVTGIRHLSYEERLQRLGLHSLLRADLITAGLFDVDPNLLFSPSLEPMVIFNESSLVNSRPIKKQLRTLHCIKLSCTSSESFTDVILLFWQHLLAFTIAMTHRLIRFLNVANF